MALPDGPDSHRSSGRHQDGGSSIGPGMLPAAIWPGSEDEFGGWCVDLSLNSPCVRGAVLGTVQRERFDPCSAGFGVSLEGSEHVAGAVECVWDVVDVAEVAVEGQRAPEVVECVGVLAGAVGDVAEGIEHVCGARRMVSAERRERGVAVLPGFVVSTEQSRAPAHRIERICFPYWV